MRAVLIDPTRFLDGINEATDATRAFYGTTLPALQAGLDSIAEGTAESFIAGVQAIQAINYDNLSPDEQEIIGRILPNIDTLRNLSADNLASVAEAGGRAYIRAFQSIADDIRDLNIFDIILGEDYNLTAAEIAEQQADTVTDFLFNALAVSAEQKAAVTEELLSQIYSGTIAGVRINPEQQATLANSLINALGMVDLPAIERSVLGFLADTESIEDILSKPVDRLTQKDLALLANYPDALDQILSGTFDINKFREEGIAAIEKDIQTQEDQLRVSMRNKQTQFERGEITQEEFEASMAIYQTNLNLLNLNRQQLRVERANIDLIRERYRMELDILNAQRKAIEDAKKMRDLQKESADIARRSIEATRTGALTTVEAQFNRQQLNAEIAEANRTLQDNIMMAQLEAQQKILEDSQQKAIEAATNANTIATRENTLAVRGFSQNANALAATFASAANVVADATGNTLTPNIPNAVNNFANPSANTRTTSSGNEGLTPFNDSLAFVGG
jgi:hypothetical protein